MRCQEVREILIETGDGNGEALPTELAVHVSSCSHCRQFLAEMGASWDLLDAWIGVEPSPDFRARFWQRVQEREKLGYWGRWRSSWAEGLLFPWPAAVVTIMVLMVAGSTLMLQHPNLAPINMPAQDGSLNPGTAADEELLLQSLGQMTHRTAAQSLEAYDLWTSSGEDQQSPALPADDGFPTPAPGR